MQESHAGRSALGEHGQHSQREMLFHPITHLLLMCQNNHHRFVFDYHRVINSLNNSGRAREQTSRGETHFVSLGRSMHLYIVSHNINMFSWGWGGERRRDNLIPFSSLFHASCASSHRMSEISEHQGSRKERLSEAEMQSKWDERETKAASIFVRLIISMLLLWLITSKRYNIACTYTWEVEQHECATNALSHFSILSSRLTKHSNLIISIHVLLSHAWILRRNPINFLPLLVHSPLSLHQTSNLYCLSILFCD